MSINAVKAAFEKQIVVLPIDIIVPQKEVTTGHRKGEFYIQLTASLKHVGLIEPLVVYPRGPRDYLMRRCSPISTESCPGYEHAQSVFT